jgi:hypothetical protein
MSDHTEDQLRAVLRDRAQIPSGIADPVALVEARMRQRFRRRSLKVAAAAALGVTAIAVSASTLGRSRTPGQPAAP